MLRTTRVKNANPALPATRFKTPVEAVRTRADGGLSAFLMFSPPCRFQPFLRPFLSAPDTPEISP
jgi:hypothetical protein